MSRRDFFIQLILILLVVGGLYIIVAYSNNKIKRDMIPSITNINVEDGVKLRNTCLHGSFADRSKICPVLIKEGTMLNDELTTSCVRFMQGRIEFLGATYTCEDRSRFGFELSAFKKSINVN